MVLSVFQQIDTINFVDKIFKEMNSGTIKYNFFCANVDKTIIVQCFEDGEIAICRFNKMGHIVLPIYKSQISYYNSKEDLIEDIEKTLSGMLMEENKQLIKAKNKQNIKNKSYKNIIPTNKIINNKKMKYDVDYSKYKDFILKNKIIKYQKPLLHFNVKRYKRAKNIIQHYHDNRLFKACNYFYPERNNVIHRQKKQDKNRIENPKKQLKPKINLNTQNKYLLKI